MEKEKNVKEAKNIKSINQMVGSSFKRYRRQGGYTQENVAEKANVTVEYLSKLEHGIYNARVSTIIDLCKAIGITPTQLLSDFFSNQSSGICELIFEESNKLGI